MGDIESQGDKPDQTPTENVERAKEATATVMDERDKPSNETPSVENPATAGENNERLTDDAQNQDRVSGAVDEAGESIVDEPDVCGESKIEEADLGNGTRTGSKMCIEGADVDNMYRRVREFALEAINAARDAKHVGRLSLDEALVVPAMTHCRTMCEHDFLSHWDIAGRKPYQRYSDFAYGQHVSEAVFGFDVVEATENEIFSRVKECIEERAGTDEHEGEGSKTHHMLEGVHTHIGIGVCVVDTRLRYVEVYADRYLELLDFPVELPIADTASSFQISIQMTSPCVGPYACLVFHDPVATSLTVRELREQFSGPYSDFTTSQVGIVWPWQMDLLDEGVFGIPVPVSPVEAGTYYIQILVRGDQGSIPYDTDPAGGLPMPGDSFCGGALVLRASEEGHDDIGISDLGGAGGLISEHDNGNLEEREARAMASSTALRRDLAPIVRVRVVQDPGENTEQGENYESKLFIPPERTENIAQSTLEVQFLRLSAWDDLSSRDRRSDETGSVGDPTVTIEPEKAASEGEDTKEGNDEGRLVRSSQANADDLIAPCETPTTPPTTTEEVGDAAATNAESVESIAQNLKTRGKRRSDAEGPNLTEEMGVCKDGRSNEDGVEPRFPMVATDITVATFKAGEKVEPPNGFELIPGDLADPLASNEGGAPREAVEGHPLGEVPAVRNTEGLTKGLGEQGEDRKCPSREMVFICVKMATYTDAVSPLTDLAVVYGTEGFQMGFGFVTVPLPQIVNDLYGSIIHLCYKKAGASLAVIQQVAEKTAEKTAKQIQQHLGIERDDEEVKLESLEDDAYDVDTNMTPEQMLVWEEKRNREAAERADKREQAERDRRQKEARDAVRGQIAVALKEKEDLVKQNGEWQKKIASLMLTQQKTREEARTEHGGRGVEKEATPVHESEKHYAESLASIVSCREKLQEQQAEYDTVAIALQTRLDEKEYRSREIADSFREFKREIARTAEHSRTGKTIPKGVISQFEAAEAKKDKEIEKVRLKNINLRMMLKKVEGSLRAKEQLAEGLHLIDFEQLKIENQTVNEKIEERNEELLKLRKKNTTTVQILTHTKEKLQFVALENSVISQQLSGLEEDLNQERDCLTRAKKDRDNLRREVNSLRQSQGFANSDLLIQDFEQRKSHLKKLGQKLEEMRSKHHLLLLEQERSEERMREQETR